MNVPALALLPLLLHATLGVPAGDVARPRLLVTIAVEPDAGINAASAMEASRIARDIWRPYVDILFAPAGEIERTIEVDELRVVITRRQLPDAESGLGWIEFVNGEPERTITVSSGVANRLMEESSWQDRPLTVWPLTVRRQFVTRALGRSMAHEVGHYLLRSKAHAPAGLMRHRMTSIDIMAPNTAANGLNPQQASVLWQRIAALARLTNERGPTKSAGAPAS